MSKWKGPDGKWKRMRPTKRFWKWLARSWGWAIAGAAVGAVAGFACGVGTFMGAVGGYMIASTGASTHLYVSLYEERKMSHPDENRWQRIKAMGDSMMEEKPDPPNQ
jgi:hypothetical protein